VGRRVLADDGEFGCVDEEVLYMELLPVPRGLDVDGVDGAGDSGGAVEEAGGGGVEVLDFEPGAEGGKGGVLLVNWASVAGEGDGSVGGKAC
jgi:hypothetical protein